MSDIDTSRAAFPGFEVLTSEYVEAHGKDCYTLSESDGMTLREYAAIKLKVPNSGTEWLDNMIRESLITDASRAEKVSPAGFYVRTKGAVGE